MEDKIEVNEYVRTKDGHIAKYIEKIAKDEDVLDGMLFDNFIYEKYKHIRYSIWKEIIVKHSKQPIDLVKVKDVIKYRIDNISTTLETKGYIEGIVDISDEEMLQEIKSDKDYHILEILTKESYMANCYKVGGREQ